MGGQGVGNGGRKVILMQDEKIILLDVPTLHYEKPTLFPGCSPSATFHFHHTAPCQSLIVSPAV